MWVLSEIPPTYTLSDNLSSRMSLRILVAGCDRGHHDPKGTGSADFPTTTDAFDTTHDLGTDAFVAKFDPAGALVYSTFIGGDEFDVGRSIAVDASGDAYLSGVTRSTDFPVTAGAFVSKGSDFDVFVAKLNEAGTGLVFSTVIGGAGIEFRNSIAVDALGRAYVAGQTQSPDFPVTPGSLDTNPKGAFIFRLNPEASALDYSTFLGGSVEESVDDIFVDNGGNAYVTGGTHSPDFPTTPGAFDTILDVADAFVAELNASGSALVFSTFLGGSRYEKGYGVYVDESGQVYVVGSTLSNDFPTSLGTYDRTYDGEAYFDSDTFVAKLSPGGSNLVYSTFLGGGDDVLFNRTQQEGDYCELNCGDIGRSVVLDSTGNTTVVGTTTALDFPTTGGAYNTGYKGGWFDAYVIRIELIPEPNRPPVAYFEVQSSPGEDARVFVSANNSADAEDATDLLEVRWDWENDGKWDTPWSDVKETKHDYAGGGTYTIRLEVRDTGGLTGNTTRQALVPGSSGIPPWAVYAVVATAGLGVGGALLFLRRRNRKTPRA